MEKLKEIFMYSLGALVVFGFFFILWIIFRQEMPPSNKEIGLMVIGALIAKFSDVVGYFFGSSKGSADKTASLNKQAEALAENTVSKTTETTDSKTN